MPSTSLHPPAEVDEARTTVRLDELVALRRRVMRGGVRLAPVATSAGTHASRRRGRGMDYLESRVYQPGDDVRHLDWRLTARSGHLHTKVFQEEHEQRVMLLVDCHASMRFGTRERFKSVQAAHAAALAAWHTVRAGGRVGALAFGPCRHAQGAGLGTRGALAVCAALARWDADMPMAAEAESLTQALRRMRPLLRGASHVILITDGRSGGDDVRPALMALRHNLRLSVLLVTDPLETGELPRGRFPLACGDERVVVELRDARVRAHLHASLAAPAQRLDATCTALGIACHRLDTCSDPLPAIRAFGGLARRRRR